MESLDDFAAFFALTTHGHMGRAAESLGITQPALSIRLRNIERSLGVALFERSAAGVRLTDAGTRINTTATHARNAIDEIREEARRIRSGEGHTIRIGVTMLSNLSRVPRIISALQKNFSSLSFVLREAATHPLEQMLANREIDLAFLHPPLAHEALSVKTLYRERFVLSVPKSACVPMQAATRSAWIAAQRFYWVGPALGPALFREVARWAQTHQLQLMEANRLSSYATVQCFVAAGSGIGIVPESIGALHSNETKTLAIPGDAPEIGFAIARRRGELPQVHRAITELASKKA
jgi:DNA-binding transcriptional LysR family regulator